jgi:hypothetical protein
MTKNEMDDDFAIKVYQQLMEHWIEPAIKIRQKNNELPSPVNIQRAQIIFCPDKENPIVNINDEVKIVAKIKLNSDEQKTPGTAVYSNEIDNFIALKLDEEKFPNCGHATFVLHRESLLLDFDLTKYRSLSREHLDAAKEFLSSSAYAFNQQHLKSFIDTLFSASELIAKSILLRTADAEFAQKTNHRAIHCKYNQHAKYGNVDNDFVKTHNVLSKLRGQARYLNNNSSININEAEEYLKTIESAYEHAVLLITDRF